MTFFTELDQTFKKFVCKHRRPKASKIILRKKNGAGGIRVPDFKLYYKAIMIKISMVLSQKETYRSMKQDRKPRNKPTYLDHLIYDKRSKNIQWRKESLQ